MEHFFQKIDGFSHENEQGELLNIILTNIDISKKLNIAEIGVYKGRCTAMWNVMLMNNNIAYDYYAIDHFEGSEEHQKNYDYYTETLNNLNPILNKINLIKNDSLSESQNYPDEFFDVVYVDASHDFESVKKDILHWYPKVKRGGIICGDDYIQGWDGVIRAVDEVFDKKINLIAKQQWWKKKI